MRYIIPIGIQFVKNCSYYAKKMTHSIDKTYKEEASKIYNNVRPPPQEHRCQQAQVL